MFVLNSLFLNWNQSSAKETMRMKNDVIFFSQILVDDIKRVSIRFRFFHPFVCCADICYLLLTQQLPLILTIRKPWRKLRRPNHGNTEWYIGKYGVFTFFTVTTCYISYRSVFLNSLPATHFWIAGTYFWFAKTCVML